MSFPGGILKGVQDAASSLAGVGSSPKNTGPAADFVNADLDARFYETKSENWYKALPYGFKWVNSDGASFYFLLPINPSNLHVDTHFATNVTTSLYGVIEEHSEQRFFDIAIEGTTGIAPRYTGMIADQAVAANTKAIKSDGRMSMSDTSDGGRAQLGANIAGGLFSRTVATVNTALNKAQGVLGSITGNKDMNRTGVFLDQTGYIAFHRLFKFFLSYKADLAGIDPYNPDAEFVERERTGAAKSAHPLVFFNYKDNCQYDCSIVSFKLKRNNEKPMLYDYSIILRAYNIRSCEARDESGDLDRVKALGLDKTPSSATFGDLKGTVEGVKRFAGSVLGGFNPIGG